MAASGFFLGTGPVVCAMFFGLLTGGGYGAAMLLGKKLEKKTTLHLARSWHLAWHWQYFSEIRS